MLGFDGAIEQSGLFKGALPWGFIHRDSCINAQGANVKPHLKQRVVWVHEVRRVRQGVVPEVLGHQEHRHSVCVGGHPRSHARPLRRAGVGPHKLLHPALKGPLVALRVVVLCPELLVGDLGPVRFRGCGCVGLRVWGTFRVSWFRLRV